MEFIERELCARIEFLRKIRIKAREAFREYVVTPAQSEERVYPRRSISYGSPKGSQGTFPGAITSLVERKTIPIDTIAPKITRHQSCLGKRPAYLRPLERDAVVWLFLTPQTYPSYQLQQLTSPPSFIC
jgi:hypothetical protein